jgi:hypothetical protein
MRRSARGKTWVIDLSGGAALTALLAAVAYCAFVEGRSAQAELSSAAADVATFKRDLVGLHNVASRHRASLAEKENLLARTGQLPAHTPTEEYFGYLSSLAMRHNLKILRQNPIPAQSYAGLREDRFAFDVVGGFSDLVEFFRAIESSPYWADVSYLRVTALRQEGAQPRAAGARAIANLTLSLFSAPHEPAPLEQAKSTPG